MKLLEATAKELENILSSKTVVGEPLQVDGKTVIPLISIGFGLGLGGGSGGGRKAGEGNGAAMGCGGGVRPVAVLISDDSGIRMEAIKGGAASVLEKVADNLGEVMKKKVAADSGQPPE